MTSSVSCLPPSFGGEQLSTWVDNMRLRQSEQWFGEGMNVLAYGLGLNGCFSGARIAWAGLACLPSASSHACLSPQFLGGLGGRNSAGTGDSRGAAAGIAGDGRMAETDCRGTPARGRTLATTRHEPTPQPTCVSPCRPRLIIIIIIIPPLP